MKWSTKGSQYLEMEKVYFSVGVNQRVLAVLAAILCYVQGLFVEFTLGAGILITAYLTVTILIFPAWFRTDSKFRAVHTGGTTI